MSKRIPNVCFVVIVAAFVLLVWTMPAAAQTAADPGSPDPVVTEPTSPAEKPELDDPEAAPVEADEETGNASHPPVYILDLVEKSELTQDQVDQMRSDDAGWGEIRIAAYLAAAISEKSGETETPVKFDEALAMVLAARAEETGFGEIAKAYDLKIGQMNRNRNQVQESLEGDGLALEDGVQAGEAVQVREKKRGLLARLGGMLGLGKAKGAEKAERVKQETASAGGEKMEKPERPARPQRAERPERPERPEKVAKLERPERPERPARPERPEKPERGPRR